MAYTKDEAARLVIAAGLELKRRGLIARTWGNISARLSDTEFLITPSGMAYEDLTPDQLVVCKISDGSYEGDVKPSSEKGVHAKAYRYRSDVNFVIHTHQLYATAYGCLGRSLYPENENEKVALGTEIPSAAYAISSTKRLAEHVGACIFSHRESNAFFMRYHGVLCIGRSDAEAFLASRLLEEKCKALISIEETATDDGEIPPDPFMEHTLQQLQERLPQLAVGMSQAHSVRSVAEEGRFVYPIIDDMAQIAGVRFLILNATDQRLVEKMCREFQTKACVFVRGKGAFLAANDADELEAVRMVCEKNCLADSFAVANGQKKHLGRMDASLQRRTYVNHYSKLK